LNLPAPEPGLVLRYSYVWRREADKGEEAGRKQRPCAIILSVQRQDGETIVYVAPVTHSPPQADWAGIQLPAAVKRRLGLDDAPSWVVTTEFNAFRWPGADLAVVTSDVEQREYFYGALPEAITTRLLELFRQNTRLGRVRAVKRTE
jgi:hypothetical protein